MRKRNFFTLAIFALVTLLLGACKKSPSPFECNDSIGCVTIAPGEPLQLGVLHDMSGSAGNFGLDQMRSI